MAAPTITKAGVFTHDVTTAPPSTRVQPLFSLTSRTAIVTGAAAGIGLAVAEALAESGANVAIFFNSNPKAHDVAARIAAEYNVQCRAYPVDVRDAEAVEKVVDTVVDEFNGRLDIMIANSGIPWTQGPMLDGSLEHARDVLRINVDGVYYCARAAGKHFRRQMAEKTTITGAPIENYRGGAFVATASMSGHIVNVPQAQTAYNASKAAVIHLCKSLAVEWAGFARANSVSPGYIVTDISKFCSAETKNLWKDRIPMGREGETSELKGAYLYLASDAASYTSGCDIVVDGGHCLP